MKKGKVISLPEPTGVWTVKKKQEFEPGLNFVSTRKAKAEDDVVEVELIYFPI